MLYLKEWIDYVPKADLKIKNIVNDILYKQLIGKDFFDELDLKLRDPNNIELIYALFQKINIRYGLNYNIVLSGKFGGYINELLKKGKIECNGTILLVSGSLTSHFGLQNKITKNKEVSIVEKTGDIEDKSFIFVDDSYYSGTTVVSINEFLSHYSSGITHTFVIYDGSDKKIKNKTSLYNYYEHHSGTNLNTQKLLHTLYNTKDAPVDVLLPEIISGKIKTTRDLLNRMNIIWKKYGVQKEIDIRNYNHMMD